MRPFRVIVADPPWRFGDKLPGPKRGAEKHYNVLSTEDICMLKLPPIADDAILFLWRVAGMQEDALAVAHMWGFDQKSELVWIKTKSGVVIEDDAEVDVTDLAFGMGRYTRACHEVCLICTRGKAASRIIKDRSVRSVFFAERQEHSRKPDKFYELIEKITGGEGPYLELFARRPRAGWTCIGDELGTILRRKDEPDRSRENGGDDSGDRGESRVQADREGEGGVDPRDAASAPAVADGSLAD